MHVGCGWACSMRACAEPGCVVVVNLKFRRNCRRHRINRATKKI